jgi:hypothetical protein
MASQLRTASVTTSYVPLTALRGTNVSILNRTGAPLLIRKATETTAGFEITISDLSSVGISIVASASEIEIKAAGAASGVNYIVE